MRLPLAILVSSACALSACGGDADADTPVITAAPTTTIEAPVDASRCETEPDPADYPDGAAPTGLRPCEIPDETTVTVIREGSGVESEPGDGVIYHATVLRAENGQLVDSSWTDGRPHNLQSVGVGDEIAGLDDHLIGVRAGDLLRLDIVADDAFGDAPPAVYPSIEAGDALTFIVDIVAVVPQIDPDAVPSGFSIEPSVGAEEVTTVDVVEGDGPVVEAGDTVIFAMRLARGDTGVILIDSWHRGVPEVIRIDTSLLGTEAQPLPGLIEGLEGARVGGVRVITMPPSAAWGDGGSPALGLPPDTDVLVVVEVLAAY